MSRVDNDEVEIRIAILEKELELKETEPYHVTVYYVVDQVEWDRDQSVRESAYLSFADLVSALNACAGVQVDAELSGVKSGDQFSWQLTRSTDEWNFANLSEFE